KANGVPGRRVLARRIGPPGVRLPGAARLLAAPGLYGERVALDAEELVLERVARDPLPDGRAEGAGADDLQTPAAGAPVVAVERVLGLVEVTVQGDSKPRGGEAFEEAVVLDAVLERALDGVVPDGDLEEVPVGRLGADSVEGAREGDGVDGRALGVEV